MMSPHHVIQILFLATLVKAEPLLMLYATPGTAVEMKIKIPEDARDVAGYIYLSLPNHDENPRSQNKTLAVALGIATSTVATFPAYNGLIDAYFDQKTFTLHVIVLRFKDEFEGTIQCSTSMYSYAKKDIISNCGVQLISEGAPVYISQSKQCNIGYKACRGGGRYSFDLNRCLYFRDDERTFFGATLACESNRMRIMEIRNEEFDNSISKMGNHLGDYWLGIYYNDTLGKYIYLSDNTVLLQSYYSGPSNLITGVPPSENCVLRRQGSWVEENCSSVHKYVCEGPSYQSPSRPDIHVQNLDLLTLEIERGAQMTVTCFTELDAIGELVFYLSWPNKQRFIYTNDRHVEFTERVNAELERDTCSRAVTAKLHMTANVSMDQVTLGCFSYRLKEIPPCSISDDYCVTVGPINVTSGSGDDEHGAPLRRQLHVFIICTAALVVFLCIIVLIFDKRGRIPHPPRRPQQAAVYFVNQPRGGTQDPARVSLLYPSL